MKRILLISLFLWSFNLANAQEGSLLFDDSFIHIIEINSIYPQTYASIHDSLHDSFFDFYSTHYLDGSKSRPYFEASVNIDGTTLDTVGLRYKGVSTMEMAPAIGKYPIKLDFNKYIKGLKYDGIKKLNLHTNLLDLSCMRAKLSFEILNRLGVVTPRTAYAKVYLNGVYRGLYTMVEQIDKTFVHNNFNPDTTGYLHKINGFGGNDGTYNTYEHHAYWNPLKTKKSTDNYQPLIDFGIEATNATDTEFANDINGIFDLNSFLKQQAVNVMISDTDHYCQAGWNFSMYLNPSDNKWYMIPWDYDLAFGAQNILIADPAAWEIFNSENNCFLTSRVMDIPSLKTQYLSSLCEAVNVGMDSIWINGRINEIKDLIATEVENDPFFWEVSDYEMYLDQAYVTNDPQGYLNGITIMGLRSYINNRYAQVVNSLANQSYDCALSTTVSVKNDFDELFEVFVSPNPTKGMVELNWTRAQLKVKELKITNTLGQEVFRVNDQEWIKQQGLVIDLTFLKNGIYYLVINTEEPNSSFTKKILKLN